MFEDICRDYFPRWKAAATWKVCDGPRSEWTAADGTVHYTSEVGYCDTQTRTIWLNGGGKVTLIHEICHAVASTGHGKKFVSRLRQAAARAKVLGDNALAAALCEEADAYENARKVSAKEVYATVGDICADMPTITLDALINYLAYQYGSTGQEILEQYPRLTQVHKSELRKSIREHERIEKFRKSHMR